jgi:complement component 1 Q subcomponent-binding protein, mitochondrial
VAWQCTIADVLLAQKLSEELQYEKTATVEAVEPDFLKSFKAQGLWKIVDTPNVDEVTCTRSFGNENIRLTFSIADIQGQEEEAFEDEEEEEEDGSDEKSPEDEPIHTYALRVVFTITKVRSSRSYFWIICKVMLIWTNM